MISIICSCCFLARYSFTPLLDVDGPVFTFYLIPLSSTCLSNSTSSFMVDIYKIPPGPQSSVAFNYPFLISNLSYRILHRRQRPLAALLLQQTIQPPTTDIVSSAASCSMPPSSICGCASAAMGGGGGRFPLPRDIPPSTREAGTPFVRIPPIPVVVAAPICASFLLPHAPSYRTRDRRRID